MPDWDYICGPGSDEGPDCDQAGWDEERPATHVFMNGSDTRRVTDERKPPTEKLPTMRHPLTPEDKAVLTVTSKSRGFIGDMSRTILMVQKTWISARQRQILRGV